MFSGSSELTSSSGITSISSISSNSIDGSSSNKRESKPGSSKLSEGRKILEESLGKIELTESLIGKLMSLSKSIREESLGKEISVESIVWASK